MVHGNLQTEHIFLTEKDDIRLGSIGNATCMANTQNKTGQSRNNNRYLAPEARQGTMTWTKKMDIWALGVILYEMCALDLPPNHFTKDQVYFQEKLLN